MMCPSRIMLLSLTLLAILGRGLQEDPIGQSLGQSKHFLVETKDEPTLFTEKEVDDVLDALPKEAKEFYNKADSSVQDSLQNEVLSVYGHDVDKMVKSAKDGSMRKLYNAAMEGGNDYAIPPGGCLSGSSTVYTRQRGPIQLRDLKLKDTVLTYTPGVGTHFTEFLGWLTRSSSTPTLMLKISTSTNSSLTLTASHIVFRLSDKGDHESVYANQLVEGDKLVRLKSRDSAVEFDEVVEIQVVWEEGGYWAPLTKEGSLLVNRFLVSSFASFPHHLSQRVSAFLETFIVLDDEASQHDDGERQVVTVFKRIGEMLGLRGWIQPAASEMKGEVNRRPSLTVEIADEELVRMSNHIEF